MKQYEYPRGTEDVVFSVGEDGGVYPKVVVLRDSVCFYDEGENLLAVSASDCVSLTCCGPYLGIATYARGPREKGVPLPAEFTMFTWEGEPRWAYRCQEPEDGLSLGFAVSAASGAAAEIRAAVGEVVFHDPRGAELRRADLFEDDEWDYARTAAGSFSPDGELFAVVAERAWPELPRYQEPIRAGELGTRMEEARRLDTVRVTEVEPPPPPPEEPAGEEIPPAPNLYLFVFDKEGNELLRRELSEPQTGHRVVFSRDGRYLAVDALGEPRGGYADAVYLFDARGDLVRKFSNLGALHVPWSPQLTFSEDSRILGIATNRRIKVVSTNDGEIMWEKEYPWPVNTKEDRAVRCFEKMDLSSDGRLILVASQEERRRSRGWGYASATVQLLGEGGTVLWERDYQDPVVAVSIVGEGDILAVATSRTVEVYRRDSEWRGEDEAP